MEYSGNHVIASSFITIIQQCQWKWLQWRFSKLQISKLPVRSYIHTSFATYQSVTKSSTTWWYRSALGISSRNISVQWTETMIMQVVNICNSNQFRWTTENILRPNNDSVVAVMDMMGQIHLHSISSKSHACLNCSQLLLLAMECYSYLLLIAAMDYYQYQICGMLDI